IVGVLVGLFAAGIPMRVWQKMGVPLFLFALIMLMVVLIPGVGREVNGARRWLPLGPVNFQPSAWMKVAVRLCAADHVGGRQPRWPTFWCGFMRLACAVAAVGVVRLMEPDLGAFIVFVSMPTGTLFIGGINIKLVSTLLLIMVGSFLALIW